MFDGEAGLSASRGKGTAVKVQAASACQPHSPASRLHGGILHGRDCLNPCAFILFSLEGEKLCRICPLLNLPQQQPESLLCLSASLTSLRCLVTLNFTGSFDVSF